MVYIETLSGRSFGWDDSLYPTIGDLKKDLGAVLGQNQEYELIFDGNILPNEMAMEKLISWGWPNIFYFDPLPHYQVVFNREGIPSLWSFLSFPTKEEEEEERERFFNFVGSAGFQKK